MSPEAYELADTFMKIGLGALITGLAAFLITGKNHKHEINKEQLVNEREIKNELLKRRLDAIESATDNMNIYLNGLSTLLSLIDGVKSKYPQAVNVPKEAYSNLQECDDTFCDSRDQRDIAGARLQLLGIDEAIKAMGLLNDFDEAIRQKIIFDRIMPSQEEMAGWYKEIPQVRADFFRVISKEYTKQSF